MIWSIKVNAQYSTKTVSAYWGSITNLRISPQQLYELESIIVLDTSKFRTIKWISKYKFFVQPALEGPVKVAIGNSADVSRWIKLYLSDPKPGDKIVVSEIFAYVENEGVRQIPTAIVLIVK